MIVGLTGGIGSGKSTAARFFADFGIPIVDADAISHQLSEDQSLLSHIANTFGSDSIQSDGKLNRAWLREAIHQNPAARQQLEALFHPRILAECKKQLQATQNTIYQILMVPLLFETPSFKALCDKTITVESEDEIRISRVMARNFLSRESVVAIINNQLSNQERRQQADYLIYNNDTLDTLKLQVVALHHLLCKSSTMQNVHKSPQL
jgi:dephospho-CoA kinase